MQQTVYGTINQAHVEFIPEANNEQMAMLEAEMRFNGLNDIREIVLHDSFGKTIGKLKVNFIDFEWEKFYAKGEV